MLSARLAGEETVENIEVLIFLRNFLLKHSVMKTTKQRLSQREVSLTIGTFLRND